MKFRAFVVLAVFLFVAPAFAQKIYIDYDQDYDLTTVKTYDWKETAETSLDQSNPLLHKRIQEMIQQRIDASAVTLDTANPDVYVTYHTESEEEMSLNTTDFGYGYPSRWGYGYGGGYGGYYGRYYGGSWGGGSSTTTVSTYQIGTLVIDIIDAESNQLVWRGAAGNITIVDNPEKMAKKIDKAITKMTSQWEKMKKKAAKG